MKKKVVGFVAFDENNRKYYDRFLKSLRKFHSEEELPIMVWDENKIKSYNDPMFFYRQKPIIAKQLIKDYELVIGFDVDQIITGDLNHILDATDYDVAAPINWNRFDASRGLQVTVWNIAPQAYFNCGLVAMRSKEFVQKWWELCFSPHFNSYQYREQDLMNIMAYYFDWKFKNLDSENTWNGLVSKGEFSRFEIAQDQLVVPSAEDGFPNKQMTVKVLHFAGGNVSGDKFDFYRLHCQPEVIEYLENLIK